MINAKIKLLQKILNEKKIDVAIFANTGSTQPKADMLYFSGYSGYGVLLIPQHGNPVLVVPALDEEKALKTGYKVVVWENKRMFEIIAEIMKKEHWKSIGINYAATSLLLYQRIKKDLGKKIKNIEQEITLMRRKKTKEEQKIIRKACALHCTVFDNVIAQWNKFKTESDAAAYFQYEAAKLGCAVSFPTIVASGKHASQPHYETANAPLQRGFCIIDCGIRYKNYCTDMTRTIFLGDPSKKEKDLYAKVLTAQEKVMEKYKIGISCKELEKKARRLLGREEKHMIHSLGHGIGLEVHEAPAINMKSKDILQNCDYVSNEPGLYYQGKLGIRIEDDILITKKEPEILTKKCGKELKIIP